MAKVGFGISNPVYKFHVNDTSDGIVGHFSGGVSNYTLISFKSFTIFWISLILIILFYT